jgi:hypothetical protein
VIEVGEGNKKQTTVTAITIYNTDPQVSSKSPICGYPRPPKTHIPNRTARVGGTAMVPGDLSAPSLSKHSPTHKTHKEASARD